MRYRKRVHPAAENVHNVFAGPPRGWGFEQLSHDRCHRNRIQDPHVVPEPLIDEPGKSPHADRVVGEEVWPSVGERFLVIGESEKGFTGDVAPAATVSRACERVECCLLSGQPVVTRRKRRWAVVCFAAMTTSWDSCAACVCGPATTRPRRRSGAFAGLATTDWTSCRMSFCEFLSRWTSLGARLTARAITSEGDGASGRAVRSMMVSIRRRPPVLAARALAG